MNKSIIVLIAFIFISSVAALDTIDTLGTFKQGQSVRIAQVCNNATWINISSLTAPNSSVLYSNIGMSLGGGKEFFFDFVNTSIVGRYDVRGISDGCDMTYHVYFNITPNGATSSDNMFLIIILITFGILILLIAFMAENEWLGFLAGVLFIISGIRILTFGLGDIAYDVYSQALGYTLIGLGTLFEVAAGYKVVEGSGKPLSDD